MLCFLLLFALSVKYYVDGNCVYSYLFLYPHVAVIDISICFVLYILRNTKYLLNRLVAAMSLSIILFKIYFLAIRASPKSLFLNFEQETMRLLIIHGAIINYLHRSYL